jgi:hypothetical protein
MNTQTLTALITLAALTASASIDFSGTLRLYPQWTHVKIEGSSYIRETFDDGIIYHAHTTGTNANQMTGLARATGTLTNSAAITLDLLGGVENSFGDALTFSRVNVLIITADGDNTDALHIGGASTAPFEAWCGTDGLAVVRPGGTLLYHAPDIVGYAVGTNGNLRVSNTGTNSAGYAVYIGGTE